MKIYDMVEGKWLKDEKEKSEKKIKQKVKEYINFDVNVRLITYDEKVS